MVTVNLAQAKAGLSELLDKVENGEAVVITRHGRHGTEAALMRLANFRARMPRLRRSSAALCSRRAGRSDCR